LYFASNGFIAAGQLTLEDMIKSFGMINLLIN